MKRAVSLAILLALAFLAGAFTEALVLAAPSSSPQKPATMSGAPVCATCQDDPEAVGADRTMDAPSLIPASGAPHPSSKLGDWSCSDPPSCGEATAKPKPLTVKAASISGISSWYDYIPGGAAAGPALRRFLGPHWRGGIVRVCAGETCVVAQLSDWCACNTGAEKLIDLDDGLFRALAPLSQGVVSVTVRAIRD